MNEGLTKDIGLKIDAYYEQIVAILLNSTNYVNNPKTDNVKIYLSFVEASLIKSFGRIIHINSFLEQKKPLMTDRMYPFCYLLESAKEKIKGICHQTEWLMNGLEEHDLKAIEVLGIEPHEMNSD